MCDVYVCVCVCVHVCVKERESVYDMYMCERIYM